MASGSDTSNSLPVQSPLPPESGRASTFPLTKWSLLLDARCGDEAQVRTLLNEVFTMYWPPLYAYLRRKGHQGDDARDLTQEFLLGLVKGEFLEGLDPSRGKFRAFLLACLKNFLSRERARQKSLKRGGGRRFFSIAADQAERRLAAEPSHDLTPEHLFELEWARALLGRAAERLRDASSSLGSSEAFDDLWPAVCGQDQALPYAELGRRLEKTEGAVKVLVHRLRRRFAELLREEIGRTVSTPEEVEEELQALFGTVALPRSQE